MAGIRVRFGKGGTKRMLPHGYEGSTCHDATGPYEGRGQAASVVRVSDQEAADIAGQVGQVGGASLGTEQQSTHS